MGRGLLLCIAALCVWAAPALAADDRYAPLDRSGPPLSVGQDKLDASLRCSAGLDGAARAPVLLSPGTGVRPEQNFSWNYERAFKRLGIPYCAYTAPSSTVGDIQVSGEYLVNAIRTMYRRAGRRIAIVGHSQGGMSMRWALRFWPDTRAMVDDVIGLAPSNHGTTVITSRAGGLKRSPAGWQQAADARFIEALNSRAETFAGISYTNIYTNYDPIVTPPQSSGLTSGGGRITNVSVQSVCPANPSEHVFIGTTDPVAYALAFDALENDGPANPGRIDRSACAAVTHPDVDPISGAAQLSAAAPGLLSIVSPVPFGDFPSVREEPPLACYVFAAGCAPRTGAPAAGLPARRAPARACASRRAFRIRLPRGIRRARVTVGGKRAKVARRGGRLTARVDLRGRPAGRVVVRIRGRDARGRALERKRTFITCARKRR